MAVFGRRQADDGRPIIVSRLLATWSSLSISGVSYQERHITAVCTSRVRTLGMDDSFVNGTLASSATTVRKDEPRDLWASKKMCLAEASDSG